MFRILVNQISDVGVEDADGVLGYWHKQVTNQTSNVSILCFMAREEIG